VQFEKEYLLYEKRACVEQEDGCFHTLANKHERVERLLKV